MTRRMPNPIANNERPKKAPDPAEDADIMSRSLDRAAGLIGQTALGDVVKDDSESSQEDVQGFSSSRS